jgi:hypothetical protein
MALAGSFPVVHQPAPEAYNAWNSRWLELHSGIATVEELKKFLIQTIRDGLKSPRKGPEGYGSCRILSSIWQCMKLTMLGIVGGLNRKWNSHG